MTEKSPKKAKKQTRKALQALFDTDLPKKYIIPKQKAQDFKTGEDIILVGYKWQNLVQHLNGMLDGEWDFHVISYQIDGTMCYANVEMTIAGNTKGQIGVAIAKDNSQKSMSIAIKSAIDDGFSRCCALNGIGMRAYLGKEDRIKFDPTEFGEDGVTNYARRIDEYMEKKKIDARGLQERLLRNGYEGTYATTDEIFDGDIKLIDVQNLTLEQGESIWKFINDTVNSIMLKILTDQFEDYKPTSLDYARLTTLMDKLGADVVKRGIEGFSTWEKAKERVDKGTAVMWNSITAWCNNIVKNSDKVYPDKKKKVEKMIDYANDPKEYDPAAVRSSNDGGY